MVNRAVTLTSKSGIYTAKCNPDLEDNVKTYIDAVDEVFPLLIASFGMEPQINKFCVEFVLSGGYYAGSGRIALSTNESNLNRERPACYDGGLVFETIHGFLEALRHPPHGIANRTIGKNRLDESFSTIIEIDFLYKVGARDAAARHKRGEGMGRAHHPLLFALVEIYEIHRIEAFHKFFKYVDDAGKSCVLSADANTYGQDEKDPYTQSYMKRLGDIFKESAGIAVTDILIEYATP